LAISLGLAHTTNKEAGSKNLRETWSYKGEIYAVLNAANIDFLKQLPEYVIETTVDYRILFSHFLFPDITGSTTVIPRKKKALKPHLNFMKHKTCLYSFVGHSHINGFAFYWGCRIHFREFGYKRLSKKQQIIFGPALAINEGRSGYMIFDTKTFELSVIKI